MSNPLVSICIPTFNGDRFITETLESVLNQTYRPLEIIISDDNSSDRTLEIVHSLLDIHLESDSDLQIRIHAHERLGLAKNWNFCLETSTGEYIKFLFQDDLLQPECVAEMVKLALQDDQIGLVFCQRDIICEDNLSFDPLYSAITTHWHHLQSIQSGLALLLDPNLLKEPLNKIGEPSNVLLAKWAIAQVGGFDSNLVQVLDWDMWLRFMAYGKVAYLDRELVSFRVHKTQVSQDNAQSGASWLDNWRLQLKMLSHRDYEFLPESLRQEILSGCISRLQNLHQIQQDTNQQVQILHSDRQAIATQLASSQEQTRISGENLAEAQKKLTEAQKNLEQQLSQTHQAHQIQSDRLTSRIDSLALELQQAHQNLAELGEDQESLHRAFLGNESELVSTYSQLNQIKKDLSQSLSRIKTMEQSKFWQLRNFWFKLKYKLGFKVESI
jgi:glycosyltransferase involved in cell wall biosynthesis